MELTSPAVPIVEEVAVNNSPYPLYTVSESGELLYQTGSGQRRGGNEFVWFTRSGEVTLVDAGWTFDPGPGVGSWSLSPDGTRMAVRAEIDGNVDIWIKELDDGPFSRLTRDEADEWSPAWTPDSEWVTFISDRGGNGDVWTKRADGTGEAELLYDDDALLQEAFWSPDEEWLLVRRSSGGDGGGDILALRPSEDSVALPLLAEEYDEFEPALSPDGRWLAYISNETSRYEVYVRPFPDVESGKWRVSTDGGIMPAWAHSGSELFFVSWPPPTRVDFIAVEFDTEFDPNSSGSPLGEKETLFPVPPWPLGNVARTLYGVTPDDQRFLAARVQGSAGDDTFVSELILVQNWFEELKERVPN